MYYSIRHLTRFDYSVPVSESVMEVRMRPRTEGHQRCFQFKLDVSPRARVFFYRDYLGNTIHHFNVPGRHLRLGILAESVVEVDEPSPLPNKLGNGAWAELDALAERGEFNEFLNASRFAHPTQGLTELAQEIGAERRMDPLSLIRDLNERLHRAFVYEPDFTRVDSLIEEALAARRGVCQDFAHIMISLLRPLRIPARYVSGYLCPRADRPDRSLDGASHAWVEVWLPGLNWVGVDPTNDIMTSERHIRAAVGRDYADVPPTRGIFKGAATSALSVAVRVTPSSSPAEDELQLTTIRQPNFSETDMVAAASQQQQQQQQQ
ncbi:MAG: transglutaminase family protein [Bryobacterales bacterium]|nr:transglutaminase family protein [Bryobacterales bacterium]